MRSTATGPTHDDRSDHGHTHDDRSDHGHSHDAALGHGHSHGPAESGIGTPASMASVAIDIGAGRGALVLLPAERFRGREIEISRVGADEPRVHTGVHERGSQAGSMLTAVFGSLPAGEYVVWEDDATAGPVVTVPEGAVAEVTLG